MHESLPVTRFAGTPILPAYIEKPPRFSTILEDIFE